VGGASQDVAATPSLRHCLSRPRLAAGAYYVRAMRSRLSTVLSCVRCVCVCEWCCT